VPSAERMGEEREKLKKLLQDTVTMLCKNSLLYEQSLCIEGVIGITVDNDDAFVVHINNTSEPAFNSTSENTEECYSNVKSEYRLTDVKLEYGMVEGPEPVMLGFSDMSSGFSHMIDPVVSELGEFKAEIKAEEDEWGDDYEESYGGLSYPWTDIISSSTSYQPQLSVPRHRSKPRMSSV